MKVNGGEANDTPNGVRTSEPLQWNECKLNKVKLNEWNERGRLAAITLMNQRNGRYKVNVLNE